MYWIVRCANLQELKRQWDTILEKNRQEVPRASFDQSEPELQPLARHLAEHSRIQWLYYSENAEGIALRLYDRAFKDSYPQHFGEQSKNNDEEWVILRGRHLGSPKGSCKRAMRAAFGEKKVWPVSRAPTNDPTNLSETLNLSTNTNDRIAYFEHPYRNNAPGAVMRPDGSESMPRQDSVTMATESLQQFRQIIFYGPPGTGKTRLARLTALALLDAPSQVSVSTGARVFKVDKLTQDEDKLQQRLSHLTEQGRFDLVVFHPAYEYEQFVGGIAPEAGPDGLRYKIEPGVFLKMARWVEQNRRPAVLVIDEINRGNLPKLLGELLYALEYRDAKVRLPFEWDKRSHLVVPKDLYIIGTMNSSDRSIGHIDVAIRRRFGLCHIGPDPDVVGSAWQQIVGWPNAEAYGRQLAKLMTDLNQSLGGEDPTAEVELGVGHSYFLPNPGSSRDAALQQVRMKWVHQVQPLLREYAQLLTLGADFFQQFRDLPTPPA